MFQKFDNNNNEKNFKFMMISGFVLIGLFIYIGVKSYNVIENGSYFIWIVFLLFLMVVAFI